MRGQQEREGRIGGVCGERSSPSATKPPRRWRRARGLESLRPGPSRKTLQRFDRSYLAFSARSGRAVG